MATSTYQHIFFDLDHTLWDFERNSTETLRELYIEYDIGAAGNVDEDTYLEIFRDVNRWLWTEYNHSRIDKQYIRERRFDLMFQRMGINPKDMPNNLGEVYLYRCPTKGHLLPYAKEILDYLAPKYTLHILTNGFKDVQGIKLESSGINGYFKTVVTSECTGQKKPSPEIFHYALGQAKAELPFSLMIGDNLDSDIGGAIGVGLDAVFYNPSKIFHQKTPKYEIEDLKNLEDFL